MSSACCLSFSKKHHHSLREVPGSIPGQTFSFAHEASEMTWEVFLFLLLGCLSMDVVRPLSLGLTEPCRLLILAELSAFSQSVFFRRHRQLVDRCVA
ncbi:hypothetical protein FOXYSP1_13332 [Fusarium oxysporum f. sp. phaseoli]